MSEPKTKQAWTPVQYRNKKDGRIAYLFEATKGYDCPGYGAKAYWSHTPDAEQKEIWVAHEFFRRFEVVQ